MQEEKRDADVTVSAKSPNVCTDTSAPTSTEGERITEVAARILKKYRVAFEELAK